MADQHAEHFFEFFLFYYVFFFPFVYYIYYCRLTPVQTQSIYIGLCSGLDGCFSYTP